ncbi:major facilitator superfamily domain-containing protein [Scheffersomyces xylosifermentans]|uniref:major facilitator superfamily domain-containing protein n=1 Tax=Scheffersomyces xylosifermentans TaxID=1304137 RepID=UPI00315D2BB2
MENEKEKETTLEAEANEITTSQIDLESTAKPRSEMESDEVPFTILSPTEKYSIVFIMSCSGIWSALSSSIYFPALPILSQKFDVSASVVNISVVAYFLFQGVTPSFVGALADAYGRKPLAFICLVCYVATCVGLARTNVYWLLAVLRCFQAASIAPINAVSGGVIGDICVRAERGSYVG